MGSNIHFSSYDYALGSTEADISTTEADISTTEADISTTEASAIGFIKALLIVVAFDDPVSVET